MRGRRPRELGRESDWGPTSVDNPNVFSSGAFRALPHFVLDGLPHAESLYGGFLQGRVVEEDVSPLTLDEAKTSVRRQFLDGTLRHVCHSLTTKPKRTRAAPVTVTQRTTRLL